MDRSVLETQPLAHVEVDANLKWVTEGGMWLELSEGHWRQLVCSRKNTKVVVKVLVLLLNSWGSWATWFLAL